MFYCPWYLLFPPQLSFLSEPFLIWFSLETVQDFLDLSSLTTLSNEEKKIPVLVSMLQKAKVSRFDVKKNACTCTSSLSKSMSNQKYEIIIFGLHMINILNNIIYGNDLTTSRQASETSLTICLVVTEIKIIIHVVFKTQIFYHISSLILQINHYFTFISSSRFIIWRNFMMIISETWCLPFVENCIALFRACR